jgi:non-specific serine/threonine protein kinase/serine/threonine-protein kinase
MSPHSQEYFARLDRLFQAALELPAGEARDAFLQTSKSVDPELADDVCRLLERDEIVQQAAQTMEPVLPRFGPYHARQVIGRGGMGTVYRATREDGEVTMEVAVKSISSPIWSSVLGERFRRERQILAQLRHPHIAAFLDGGLGEDGLPFLVMELVDGRPIDVHCDAERLGLRRRLQIFLEVCAAVDFAHRQLIVHRDIKPSNLLVTAEGEPKLLDFGLARSMELTATKPDNPTLFFTPLYSSPEVLRGKPAAVADDVYSLGVLLYKLLIGARPFDCAGTTPAEIVDSVLHSEPRRASAVLRGMEPVEAARVAGARSETTVDLRRMLEGDLDAIALRSVAVSAAERYGSVAELAADVSRYLEGRPVRAVAGGWLYRTRKFVRRYKVPVAAAALVALSLTAGVVATLVEAREAGIQRAAAERRFQDAHELAHYMMFQLQNSIQKLPGSTPIKADMVKHSLDYLDRIAAEKSTDDSLRVETAEGYTELADVLGHPLRPNLGKADQAREIYAKAIAQLEPVAARNPGNQRARRALARSRLMLGMSLIFYRQWDKGGKLVESAASDLVKMADASPQDFAMQRAASDALESLGVAKSQPDGYTSGGHEDATIDLKKSIDYANAALRLKPGDPETVSQLATSYNRLALQTQTHDRPAAATYFSQAISALDKLPLEERQSAPIPSRRAQVLLGMGWNLGSMGRFDDGIATINEARAMMEQLAAEDPQNRIYPQARATIYRNLGVIEDYAGRTVAALAAYKSAISIYEQMLAANGNNPYFRTTLADVQANAALLSLKLGRHAEAEKLIGAGLPVLKQTAMQKDASSSELNLAARFLTKEEFPKFCDARLGLELAQRANKVAEGKDYVVLETLGQAYWINRDRDGAAQSIEQALSLIEAPTPGNPTTRVRRLYEATLTGYKTDRLSIGCPAVDRH